MSLENITNKLFTILTTLILIFYLGTANCQDNSGIAKISGKIEHPNSNKVLIRGKNYRKEIKLNEKGEFSDTLKISNGEYSFYDYSESTTIYLEVGFNLFITLDTKEFDETINYSGIGNQPNNFLASYYLFKEKNTIDFKSYKEMSNQEYFDKELKIFEESNALLNSMEIVNENFIVNQEKVLLIDHLNNLINKMGKDYFLNKTTAFITQYMDKKIDDINFNDQSLLSISSLSKFINSYFSIGLVADNISCLNIYNSELSKQQKQDVLTTLKRGISFYNLEDLESYYTTLRKLITDNNIFSAVEEKYQKILNLQKGNPSPSFNYSDTSGQNISLESLKGKLVYIDVWATWCGPCKAQIPYLKELEEKYRTREIAFVSMSIDKPKDAPKWKKMIQDKELSGIQIMADNAWGSSFVNEYVIEGIPRFILLDRNGNIINANAPRPATFNKGSYILNDAIEELLLMNL